MFGITFAKLRAWLAMPELDEYAPSTLTDPRQFADSVNAKLVMPSKRLLDKSRDCTDYFKTDVQRTFALARQEPKQRPRRVR